MASFEELKLIFMKCYRPLRFLSGRKKVIIEQFKIAISSQNSFTVCMLSSCTVPRSDFTVHRDSWALTECDLRAYRLRNAGAIM